MPASNVQAPAEHGQPREASVVQTEDSQPVESPAAWVWPKELQTKVGVPGLSLISRWWERVRHGDIRDGWRLTWMSGVQVYVDFMMSVDHPGPIDAGRKWWFGLPFDELAPTFVHRVHSFVRLLVQWWSHNGWICPSRHVRNESAVLVRRFNCYRVCWDPNRLQHVVDLFCILLGVKSLVLLNLNCWLMFRELVVAFFSASQKRVAGGFKHFLCSLPLTHGSLVHIPIFHRVLQPPTGINHY